MADLKKLALKVKMRRAELGMSQKDLAEESGLGIVTIYFLENGQRNHVARIDTLVKIAKALQLDSYELVKFIEEGEN